MNKRVIAEIGNKFFAVKFKEHINFVCDIMHSILKFSPNST